MSRVVQNTRELQRILTLPRRDPGVSESFARRLSEQLRRPGSKALLRTVQAWALYEIWQCRGLFGPIRVGAGKTLISLLAAFVLGARRPLLLLPAKLIEKTNREMRLLSNDWLIPNYIQIMSYEKLGRVDYAARLEHFRPDLVIADECHRIKNPRAAVSKRVRRHFAAHPETMLVALSGTVTKRSLRDYARIATWCLKPAGVPVPNGWGELEDWADTLDEHDRERPDVGALVELSGGSRSLKDLRRGFQDRLVSTPGVVTSQDSRVASSLSVTGTVVNTLAVDDAIAKLRRDWETPDGWTLNEGMAVWRHVRELALGFYYAWDPRPPNWWLQPRKLWSRVCRYILNNNARRLDSELQVTRAVDEGQYPRIILEEPVNPRDVLQAWRAVRDRFEPNTVPVWIDRGLLRWIEQWSIRQADPAIIWCEHAAFAEALAEATGLLYYGREGKNKYGAPIEAHDKGTVIASIASNAEGRNLQAWCNNLVVSPPPSGQTWEQMLGRTHRDGQTADEVTYEAILSCAEHVSAIHKARSDARYVLESTGQEQKLLYCDLVMPETSGLVGPKWEG